MEVDEADGGAYRAEGRRARLCCRTGPRVVHEVEVKVSCGKASGQLLFRERQEA